MYAEVLIRCGLESLCRLSYQLHAGLSLRAGGRGFSLATKRVAPGYFYWKRKIEPKEIPSRLIPRLLFVFTRQLEILVTTLLHALKSIWVRVGLYITQSYKGYVK